MFKEELDEIREDVKAIKSVIVLFVEDDPTTGRTALLPWLFKQRSTIESAGRAGRWIIRGAGAGLLVVAAINGFFRDVGELIQRLLGR